MTEVNVEWQPISNLQQHGIPAYRSKRKIAQAAGAKLFHFSVLRQGQYHCIIKSDKSYLTSSEVKKLQEFASKFNCY